MLTKLAVQEEPYKQCLPHMLTTLMCSPVAPECLYSVCVATCVVRIHVRVRSQLLVATTPSSSSYGVSTTRETGAQYNSRKKANSFNTSIDSSILEERRIQRNEKRTQYAAGNEHVCRCRQ
jgi:hypothetical protein